MYNAFVLPHFNYCSTIWNDGSCTIINKLSKLQRRAARVITSSTYDIRSSQILKDLNWKPIEADLKNSKRNCYDIQSFNRTRTGLFTAIIY